MNKRKNAKKTRKRGLVASYESFLDYLFLTLRKAEQPYYETASYHNLFIPKSAPSGISAKRKSITQCSLLVSAPVFPVYVYDFSNDMYVLPYWTSSLYKITLRKTSTKITYLPQRRQKVKRFLEKKVSRITFH